MNSPSKQAPSIFSALPHTICQLLISILDMVECLLRRSKPTASNFFDTTTAPSLVSSHANLYP